MKIIVPSRKYKPDKYKDLLLIECLVDRNNASLTELILTYILN